MPKVLIVMDSDTDIGRAVLQVILNRTKIHTIPHKELKMGLLGEQRGKLMEETLKKLNNIKEPELIESLPILHKHIDYPEIGTHNPAFHRRNIHRRKF